MTSPVDLKLLFASTQQRLAAQLRAAREHIGHPGDKGTVSEIEWVELLSGFLPERYRVAKATVVDSAGAISESIDIVVFDRQYSPLVFEQRDFRYVAAEAVYAVFEVKQVLNAEYVSYAAKKAASVRKLIRTSAPVVDIRGDTPQKRPIPILAGLLTTEIEWKAETVAHNLSRHLGSQDEDHALDLLCAADGPAFEVKRSGGSVQLEASTAKTGLVFFMFGLLQRLQQVGTVAPIDFSVYRRAI